MKLFSFNTLIQITILSLIASVPLQAQDQAERLYDNATTFINAGKFNEALTDLETIINSFGQSAWAPKALLTIGEYYLKNEKDYAQATTYFGRIQSEYAQSAEAPAALYYKAVILERQGESIADLESATADLLRMQNLYPGSAWEAPANLLFGKIALRLGNYLDSLDNFHKLEFRYPQSPLLPEALLHSALAAWLDKEPKQSALLLSRLQARFPSTPEADLAAALMRLLDRFAGGKKDYELDPTFYGSTPKTWSSPTSIVITADDLVGVAGQKNVTFAPLGDYSQLKTHNAKTLKDLCLSREGRPLMVYGNLITDETGKPVYGNLSTPGGALREIRSAAVDNFGRLFVVDDYVRDVSVFDKHGQHIKDLGAGRSKNVRTYAGKVWVSTYDGSMLRCFDGSMDPIQVNIGNVNGIVDFRFDLYGNLYVLSKKGQSISVYDVQGRLHHSFDLKTGNWPMKQAQAIGVDAVGAIYLSDRRSGAVYRFH